MGIGNKLSETLGEAYIRKGCRYFCKTSNPRIGEHRNKSPLWRPTAYNMKSRSDYLKYNQYSSFYGLNAENAEFRANKICYSHEYIGDGTKYPYTLNETIKEGTQLTLFD